MRERPRAGLGLALLSALAFATSGTFARPLLAGEWSAAAVVIARVGVAALVLGVPALLALRGRWPVLRRNGVAVVLFGLLGVALAQACFYNAVQYLPVGVALMLEYLGIVMVVGWMWLVHGQRPRLLTVAGSLAALCGLALVLDLTGAGGIDPVGVLWGLGAGVGLAGYYVIAGRVDAELPSVVMASGGMAVGALVLLLLGAVGALPLAAGTGDVSFAGHRMSWLVPIVGLSLIAAVVAYLAGVAGARLLGARLSSFIGLTEVMFAVLIAWLVLNELPSGIQLVGGVFIVGGVALVRMDELRAGPGPAAPAPPAPALAGER
ncbi:Threonine/homoserine efflux transporter RhtA [Micromonospora sediminicola]|uniref:Threonine/homoserine efflux transporter RhtA n=1 Tax=Micromonospora sediminicola TaxID=946078 RepID=A0A1A9B4B2_9ACTN|nr:MULTISPECIES: EamA family transporter [Micromonospora]PGH41277.1 EamA family transporter [Micromonospora sp. WMMA1996]SBT63891.1 Threonine/homoserine efflux transporter RhtA [Micromonospora sediminicola]